MIKKLKEEVSTLVRNEYLRVAEAHGGAANTPHEGYALIKEEEEEAGDQMSLVSKKVSALWWAVKADDLALQAGYLTEIRAAAILGACELIQVAAMADKAIEGLRRLGKDGGHTERE